jgi:hypothetical protein
MKKILPSRIRIAIEGWSKEDAIREMTTGGYGFHEIWVNLPKWIQELDIESAKLLVPFRYNS